MSTPYDEARALIFRPSEAITAFSSDLNRASLVAVHAAGLVDAVQAGRLAGAIDRVAGEQRPDVWTDYLEVEARLVELVGDDASLIHLGRSRQDMFSAVCRDVLRTALLDVMHAVNTLRNQLLALAGDHIETVIPGYTHGLQAQPTTLAHYLLAICESFGRGFTRLSESYRRANQSPLGAGALTTSRFDVDRGLLARLLGFDGVVDNSYGANHVAPTDAVLEAGSAFATLAVQATQFAQDIHAGYLSPRPWLHITHGSLTGISSMMPQKRNPSALETMRELAAVVIGRHGALFASAHNLPTGMPDPREDSLTQLAGDETRILLELTAQVVDALEVDPDLALAECRHDYATMTELADLLYAAARVPFRTGHHFASDLTDYGRARGLTPTEIGYEHAQDVYLAATGSAFPLTAEQYESALDPRHFVATRAGQGGPQFAETRRMLTTQRSQLAEDTETLDNHRSRLAGAADLLISRFQQLGSLAA
ncbi:argininosuccinate lyase [Kribbella pittospori]|uniref:argininosuccinate lyase n=1 Tax=Kribbella pittospori TaxID=722689 RepID=A0A4R0JYB3_9ACTN|nr:lyase family protein [Kribbella pittospori]TCC50336.1 argininosuccinate lyase [Kribbella pittospori]